MTVHEVAERYGQSPETVEGWRWQTVVRAQLLARARAGAEETVQKHQESRRR